MLRRSRLKAKNLWQGRCPNRVCQQQWRLQRAKLHTYRRDLGAQRVCEDVGQHFHTDSWRKKPEE